MRRPLPKSHLVSIISPHLVASFARRFTPSLNLTSLHLIVHHSLADPLDSRQGPSQEGPHPSVQPLLLPLQFGQPSVAMALGFNAQEDTGQQGTASSLNSQHAQQGISMPDLQHGRQGMNGLSSGDTGLQGSSRGPAGTGVAGAGVGVGARALQERSPPGPHLVQITETVKSGVITGKLLCMCKLLGRRGEHNVCFVPSRLVLTHAPHVSYSVCLGNP